MATPGVAARGGERGGNLEAAIEADVRRELARELHDSVAQTLTGMLIEVENFKSHEVGWQDVLQELETVQASTRQVLAGIRQLLHDLRGEGQVGSSLIDALRSLIARFEEKTSVQAVLDVRPGWPASLTAPAYLNLYRIVEEALANVRMHSGASSVRIMLESMGDRGELALRVDDDGRGVDTNSARPTGLGTVGMKERAMFLGGRLHIESEPGVGTTVHAVFPAAHLIAQPDLITTAELIANGA